MMLLFSRCKVLSLFAEVTMLGEKSIPTWMDVYRNV